MGNIPQTLFCLESNAYINSVSSLITIYSEEILAALKQPWVCWTCDIGPQTSQWRDSMLRDHWLSLQRNPEKEHPAIRLISSPKLLKKTLLLFKGIFSRGKVSHAYIVQY